MQVEVKAIVLIILGSCKRLYQLPNASNSFFFFQIYQGKNNSTIIFIFCPFAPTTSRSSDVQLYAQRPFNMEFSFSASLLANIPPVFKKEDLWNSPVSITLANHADQPN